MSRERAVRGTLRGHLRQTVEDDIDVTGVFTYRTGDPFAVSITFSCDGDTIEWWVGRHLLREGLVRPAGIPGADFRVLPLGRRGRYPTVLLALASGEGTAAVEFSADQIWAFLEATHELVPWGAESGQIDMDGEIAAVLGSA